jgi:hypothetical protein
MRRARCSKLLQSTQHLSNAAKTVLRQIKGAYHETYKENNYSVVTYFGICFFCKRHGDIPRDQQ